MSFLLRIPVVAKDSPGEAVGTRRPLRKFRGQIRPITTNIVQLSLLSFGSFQEVEDTTVLGTFYGNFPQYGTASRVQWNGASGVYQHISSPIRYSPRTGFIFRYNGDYESETFVSQLIGAWNNSSLSPGNQFVSIPDEHIGITISKNRGDTTFKFSSAGPSGSNPVVIDSNIAYQTSYLYGFEVKTENGLSYDLTIYDSGNNILATETFTSGIPLQSTLLKTGMAVTHSPDDAFISRFFSFYMGVL